MDWLAFTQSVEPWFIWKHRSMFMYKLLYLKSNKAAWLWVVTSGWWKKDDDGRVMSSEWCHLGDGIGVRLSVWWQQGDGIRVMASGWCYQFDGSRLMASWWCHRVMEEWWWQQADCSMLNGDGIKVILFKEEGAQGGGKCLWGEVAKLCRPDAGDRAGWSVHCIVYSLQFTG